MSHLGEGQEGAVPWGLTGLRVPGPSPSPTRMQPLPPAAPARLWPCSCWPGLGGVGLGKIVGVPVAPDEGTCDLALTHSPVLSSVSLIFSAPQDLSGHTLLHRQHLSPPPAPSPHPTVAGGPGPRLAENQGSGSWEPSLLTWSTSSEGRPGYPLTLPSWITSRR